MRVLLMFFWVLGAALPAPAQATPAATTANPGIALVDLDARLLPLLRPELQVEADGWLQLVRQTCKQIADREVRARAAAVTALRDRLFGEAGELQTERTARIDRLLRVVGALQQKGGAEETLVVYRQYATAVSGIQLDACGAST